MTETVQAMASIKAKYRQDPVFYVEHALGHHTWSKQREVLNSIRDNERTAVRASHSVTKTFSAAEATTWFLNNVDDSKVITTAPTFFQIEKQLWAEINRIYATSRIKLEGECLMTGIKTDDPDHFAIGFSTDKPSRAEGWHAKALLFIFDEAKGLPKWLWDAARGALAGGFCRWLAISTTDGVQVGEPYHKIFTGDGEGWNRIHISAYDSPYMTGEKFRYINIPDAARLDRFTVKFVAPADIVIPIAGPKYIEDGKKEWGEDSVLFQTKVKGEIVDAGADTIIKLSQAMKMFANAKNESFNSEGQEEAGVDVARGGADDTALWRRKGMKVVDHKTITSKDLPAKAKLVHVANEVKCFVAYDKTMPIKVDDTGVGGGVTDILQADGYNVIPVNFGAEAKEPDKYPNTISEMWLEVAALISEISCPEDNRLLVELTGRKQKPLDKKGRRVVESKDDYKARGFRSPDVADGFLLCFYNPSKQYNIGFEVH